MIPKEGHTGNINEASAVTKWSMKWFQHGRNPLKLHRMLYLYFQSHSSDSELKLISRIIAAKRISIYF